MAETIIKTIDNPEQEYIIEINNDNHHTVMVISNGKAVLVNTSGVKRGNYEYFTKNIQKIAREKYKESHKELCEKELKEKIKIRELRFTNQGTGNCSLVGNVKTAKLVGKFDGDCKRFVNSSINLIKLSKDKELENVIDTNNPSEVKDIKETAEKVLEVVKDITGDKNRHFLLAKTAKDLDGALGKITEFEKSKNTNITPISLFNSQNP